MTKGRSGEDPPEGRHSASAEAMQVSADRTPREVQGRTEHYGREGYHLKDRYKETADGMAQFVCKRQEEGQQKSENLP